MSSPLSNRICFGSKLIYDRDIVVKTDELFFFEIDLFLDFDYSNPKMNCSFLNFISICFFNFLKKKEN